ncbi:HIG1 domain family member 2A, mitochondrial-like [Lycorma delicatula]|uniref:HIG1 domain family member 2A, mitochondrial-like n=1 Tax=Lycorma delicatula TaxID=130591 RepID=UPI003F51578D
MSEKLKPKSETNDLEWLRLRPAADVPLNEETFIEKFYRKFKENPFVPLGALATSACLGLGLWHLKGSRSDKQQIYMRGRVLAQSFTIAAFVVGTAFFASKRDEKP